ncbi:MAG TPA: hypothetical protein VN231_13885 [Allosphingosinicella sp.]|nr:hypothetical protein [Allosphingosinicella sp.]
MEAAVERGSNGLGTGAMVTGIVALVLALIPGIGIVSLIAGPVAVVLGLVAMNRKGLPTGSAKAGLVTGIIAVAIAVAWLVYLGGRVAADRAAGASGEVTTEWLIGEWSAERGNCAAGQVTTFKADASYTAPSNNPDRLALGIWSVENGILEMGNIFQQYRFRVERVSGDELSRQIEGGPATRLYRC